MKKFILAVVLISMCSIVSAEEPKQLKDMSITEKKAMIYDLLGEQQKIAQNIQILQNSIAEETKKAS